MYIKLMEDEIVRFLNELDIKIAELMKVNNLMKVKNV
jgi:hypothetical protein